MLVDAEAGPLDREWNPKIMASRLDSNNSLWNLAETGTLILLAVGYVYEGIGDLRAEPVHHDILRPSAGKRISKPAARGFRLPKIACSYHVCNNGW